MQKERRQRRNLEEEVSAEAITGHKVCVYCHEEIQGSPKIKEDKFGNEVFAACEGECYNALTGKNFESKAKELSGLLRATSRQSLDYRNKKLDAEIEKMKEETLHLLLLKNKAFEYTEKFTPLLKDCYTAMDAIETNYNIYTIRIDENLQLKSNCRYGNHAKICLNDVEISFRKRKYVGDQVIYYMFSPVLFPLMFLLNYTNPVLKRDYKESARRAAKTVFTNPFKIRFNDTSIYGLCSNYTEELEEHLESLSKARDVLYQKLKQFNEVAQKYEDFAVVDSEIKKIAESC